MKKIFSWFKERLSEVIKISKNDQGNIIFLNPNETEKIVSYWIIK